MFIDNWMCHREVLPVRCYNCENQSGDDRIIRRGWGANAPSPTGHEHNTFLICLSKSKILIFWKVKLLRVSVSLPSASRLEKNMMATNRPRARKITLENINSNRARRMTASCKASSETRIIPPRITSDQSFGSKERDWRVRYELKMDERERRAHGGPDKAASFVASFTGRRVVANRNFPRSHLLF